MSPAERHGFTCSRTHPHIPVPCLWTSCTCSQGETKLDALFVTKRRSYTAAAVVVNDGANHKVAGSLVLLFKEVVASQVNVGAAVDVSPIMTLATSQILLSPTAGTGAYSRTTRILTAVGWVVVPLR